MNSPETATTTKPSLAQDWLYALRYWLRGWRGLAALALSALALAAALNWSWLVAVGIAPFLIAVLPCVVMCGLGLCVNKIAGRSCSTETNQVAVPKPDSRVGASLEPGEPDPALLRSDASTRRPRRS